MRHKKINFYGLISYMYAEIARSQSIMTFDQATSFFYDQLVLGNKIWSNYEEPIKYLIRMFLNNNVFIESLDTYNLPNNDNYLMSFNYTIYLNNWEAVLGTFKNNLNQWQLMNKQYQILEEQLTLGITRRTSETLNQQGSTQGVNANSYNPQVNNGLGNTSQTNINIAGMQAGNLGVLPTQNLTNDNSIADYATSSQAANNTTNRDYQELSIQELNNLNILKDRALKPVIKKLSQLYAYISDGGSNVLGDINLW